MEGVAEKQEVKVKMENLEARDGEYSRLLDSAS